MKRTGNHHVSRSSGSWVCCKCEAGEWKDGKVERCKNIRLERWKDKKVERWKGQKNDHVARSSGLWVCCKYEAGKQHGKPVSALCVQRKLNSFQQLVSVVSPQPSIRIFAVHDKLFRHQLFFYSSDNTQEKGRDNTSTAQKKKKALKQAKNVSM